MLDWTDDTELTAETDDITVCAYKEQLDSDDERRSLWGYCLRIENNSDQRIRLLKKDFCLTDSAGNNVYDLSDGFNGELPDLEPGEYFEYEDTAIVDRDTVLYGACVAQTETGRRLNIKLPVLQLSQTPAKFYAFAC
ncbi:MAG: ApaG domain [Alphaproteobacteria bacterium]|nr:ApaG domain [Alphaproteobacteria bacterium]